MSRLRSGPSTLDAWVRPFRRTTLQLQLRTQESAAAPSFGIVLFPSWPPLSRCLLSPLLARLYDFAQIENRPYLNRSKSILKAWLL